VTLPVAILAGGLATRLRPITADVPKALLDVAGRPFVEHQLDLLRRSGVERVVLCLGHLGEQVQTALGDGRRFGLSLAYAHDGGTLLGTGGALRHALPILGEAFLVLYGDSYLECDYAAVAHHFEASGRLGLMTVFRNEGRWDTSNVEYRDGHIVRYDKTDRTSAMTHIDWGLGALRAGALTGYPEGRPLDLATVYRDLLARGQLATWEASQRFYEIGSPAGLDETRRHLSATQQEHP
jgi:NDP-sugar pyrophosphorylase family protein